MLHAEQKGVRCLINDKNDCYLVGITPNLLEIIVAYSRHSSGYISGVSPQAWTSLQTSIEESHVRDTE